MKKALFLFNQHAGKGRISAGIPTLVDKLTKKGFLVTTYPTQSKGDATEKISQIGSGYDRIIVAGGDGMLHEAINGVLSLKNQPDLGYIPSGTINDFAKSHRIPLSVNGAADIACGEKRKTIDVGSFNGEYFSYVAAFGAGTDIAYGTDQNLKNILGQVAYYMSAVKYIDPKHLKDASSEMEIVTDNGTFEGRFVLGAVTNTMSVGGFRQVIPKETKLDDGILEGLFILMPLNIFEANQIVNNILAGKLNSHNIISTRSSVFKFKIKEPAAWTLDGENGGKTNEAIIKDRKQCLTMLLP